MDGPNIPNTPSELTVEWLSRALQGSELLEDGVLTGFDIEIIGEDRGFTGVIARVALEFERHSPRRSLIAKFPLAERGVESSFRRAQSGHPAISGPMIERATREIDFYRANDERMSSLPRCYNSYADIDAGQAVLLLEDLSSCEPGDALLGCSVDEARSVLTSLGEFHAGWWQDATLPELAWPALWSATYDQRATRYREQVEPVIDAYGGQLSRQTIALLRSLVAPFHQMLDELDSAPETLIHADMHLDNVMFSTMDNNRQAIIIDWQSPSRGRAMIDVAGFLVDSLSVEDRRRSEIDLLREYHEILRQTGIRDYPFDRLFDDYLRGICVRLSGQISWLHRIIDGRPDGREGELVDAILDPGRIFVALLDHVERIPIPGIVKTYRQYAG